jgi:hypothetical protein
VNNSTPRVVNHDSPASEQESTTLVNHDSLKPSFNHNEPSTRASPDGENRDLDNRTRRTDAKVKGDLFEIFAECFLNIFSAHPRIGVYDYRPGPAVDDYGVDGYGVGMDNNPCTVQVKFRQNITSELVLDDIKNFEGFSYRNYKVPVDTTTNLIFFTNAKGLNFVTEAKVLSGASRTIGNKLIRELVDNNNVFWKELLEMVESTIKEKYN